VSHSVNLKPRPSRRRGFSLNQKRAPWGTSGPRRFLPKKLDGLPLGSVIKSGRPEYGRCTAHGALVKRSRRDPSKLQGATIAHWQYQSSRWEGVPKK